MSFDLVLVVYAWCCMPLQKRHELSLMEHQCSCKLQLAQGLQEPFEGEWVAQWNKRSKSEDEWAAQWDKWQRDGEEDEWR